MESEEKPIRFNEYMEKLQEQRRNEIIKTDIINELNIKKGEGLTSPTTDTTTEETRLLMEYMDRSNIFNISQRNETLGKALKLRKFFRFKRNQQVEVYSKWGKEALYTEGKVSAIGRDFVMLTDLKTRIWIPYSAIESANIPYGIPNYSNTHQHFIYDNNYRQKLLYNFGETVSKRDVLKQQFFEESLRTNLESWKDTWVEILLKDGSKIVGKIKSTHSKSIILILFKHLEDISIADIQYVKTLRFLAVFRQFLKKNTQFLKN